MYSSLSSQAFRSPGENFECEGEVAFGIYINNHDLLNTSREIFRLLPAPLDLSNYLRPLDLRKNVNPVGMELDFKDDEAKERLIDSLELDNATVIIGNGPALTPGRENDLESEISDDASQLHNVLTSEISKRKGVSKEKDTRPTKRRFSPPSKVLLKGTSMFKVTRQQLNSLGLSGLKFKKIDGYYLVPMSKIAGKISIPVFRISPKHINLAKVSVKKAKVKIQKREGKLMRCNVNNKKKRRKQLSEENRKLEDGFENVHTDVDLGIELDRLIENMLDGQVEEELPTDIDSMFKFLPSEDLGPKSNVMIELEEAIQVSENKISTSLSEDLDSDVLIVTVETDDELLFP